MKKLITSVLLPALLLFSSASSSNAFSENVKEVKLWAPPVMLEGHEYDAMIIVVGYNEDETKFDIISNNENVVSTIDREIIIEPFKSHGMAKVKAKTVGKADLFAVAGERLLTVQVEVVQAALVPSRLEIVIPSDKVEVRQIPAYVFLFDSFDNPLRAPEDIEVSLASFGGIKMQTGKATIKQGMPYSRFIVNVEGDGGLTAAANNLKSDTKIIDFRSLSDEIELKVKIAPDILASSSSGELYVWLEKDGRPYIPDKDIKVVLSTEDSRFLAFSKAVQSTAPLDRDILSTEEIFIKRGHSFAHTMVWTTDLLTKLGEDSREVTVTAVSEVLDSASTTVRISKPVKNESNAVRVFALPDPAFDKLDIIVALYFNPSSQNKGEDLCPEGTTFNPETEECEEEKEEGTDLRPVIISESITVHIATDSLLEAEFESIRIAEDDLDNRDHYIVIPARTLGKLGLASIAAAAGGTGSAEVEVEVAGRYTPIPKIGVKTLPTLAEMAQDMLIVYTVEEGILNDTEIRDLIVKTKPALSLENSINITSIKIVKGRSPNLVPEQKIEVTAIAPGFMAGEAVIPVFNPDLRHVIAYHPPAVHVGESFPIVFYATDERKHPIELIEPTVSSSKDFARIDGGLYMLSSASERNFVFYADGVNLGTSKIDVFSYDITLNASIDETEFDLGDRITIAYQVFPTDAKVVLDTELPFERSGNNFIIESTIPGNHRLSLTAEKEGSHKVTREFEIEIRGPAGSVNSETGPSDFDVRNFPDALRSGPLMLLAIAGILVAIAGGIFYVLNRRKSKPRSIPSEDLTFLFRGDADWSSIYRS